MGRVLAIAGGTRLTNRPLYSHAVKLSYKKNPNVLFIGTASRDAAVNIEVITEEYGSLGCQVKSLCLITESYSEQEIDSLLSWADIIYVGGGDTIFMMQTWKRFGLDEKLKRIFTQDLAVLSGISAGAICWFTCGHSDSESFHMKEGWNFCWANGMLDLIHMAYCPHYNEEGRNSFDAMLKEKNMTGIAMENDTAFVYDNGTRYFIKSTPDAKAFLMRYQGDWLKKQDVSFVDA